MRIKKIYFNRRYNQWRDEPIFIEDEIYDKGLCVYIVDVKFERGSINTIIADFKDSNGGTYSVEGVVDYRKKTATFKIPSQILSNDGVYEVVFSISYNEKNEFIRTAIQTFTIMDTIEIDDEAIQQETNYPVLVDLINNMANYKVDTSNFPTREEMMEAIEEGTNATSIEEILKVFERKGYITKKDLDMILLNYVTKSNLSNYATQSDLNKFVTNLKFIQELDRYQLKTSMSNYVLKEEGKGLSTHDLTDELYDKLVDLDINNGEVNIDLSEYQKQTDDRLTTKDKTIVGSINEVKNNIPTKTSQLQNDSGYLTEHQDLSDYATKYELHNHDNKDVLDNITQDKFDSWDNKSEFSGSYNDLTDKPIIPTIPDIPTKVSQLENDSNYATENFVTDKIIEANLGGDIDLSEYAKTSDIPTKVSQLTNDSNFISSIPSEYVTETELNEKGYALKSDLHTHSNKYILDNITSDKIDSWDNKSDFSGSYNDLTDKPITPSINNTTISETEVYSSSKTEERLSEIEMNIDSDITAVSDGVIEIDERVNYLEEKQLIIDAFDGTYDSLLDKPTIPSKISELNNDSNFATETFVTNKIAEASLSGGEVDLSGLATKDELNTKVDKVDGKSLVLDTEIAKIHSHDNKTILDNITQTKVIEWNNKSDFSGSYDDLTNKPTIPSKVSQLTNDSNFISSIPSEYVTETELNEKGYSTFSGSYNDLTDKPTIPSEYNLPIANQNTLGGIKVGAGLSITAEGILSATGGGVADSVAWENVVGRPINVSVFNNDAGYLTEHQDISNLALKSELHNHTNKTVLDNITSDKVTSWDNKSDFSGSYDDLTDKPTIPSTEGLATETYVNNKVSELVDSAPETLDTLKELATALGNDPNFATTISNQIGNKVDKVNGKGLSTNDLTNELKSNYDTAYTHSQQAHAPSNAQKNSDITKSEIEAKLTGDILSHTHSQYLTEHQDLSDYALTTDLHSHTNKTVLDNITDTRVSNWNTAYTHSQSSHFSGSYNDLTNKPTIPIVTNDLTNILKSNYDTAYTHSQSAHAPSNAQKNSDITKAEIEAKLTGNITTHTHNQYLTSHQSLADYVKSADLSTVATSGSYNDLTDRPTIPNAYTLPIASANALGGVRVGSGLQIDSNGILSTTGGTGGGNNLTDIQVNSILTSVFGSQYLPENGGSGGGTGGDTPTYTSQFASALYNATTWQVFGDSISTTYNISESQIWHNLITADSEFSSLTKYNNSLTGSEISDGGRSIDSFVERYTSLNSNADLVTVFGGVNDWGHNNIPLGNYDDVTTNRSFYGALNTLLPGIKTQCPNARIIWLSPLKTKSNTSIDGYTNTDGTNGFGLYLTDYIQAIKYKCHQYNVEFVDLYGVTGLDPDINTSNFQGDGLHPTASGHVALKDYLLNTATVSVPEDEYVGGGSTATNTVTVESLHGNNHINFFYAIDASSLNSGDTVVVSWAYSNASTTPTNFNGSASFYSNSYENAIRTSTSDGCAGGYGISQAGNFASGTSTTTVGNNANNYPYFLAMTSFGNLSANSLPITWHIDNISVTVNGSEVPILGAGGFFTDESIIVNYNFGGGSSDSDTPSEDLLLQLLAENANFETGVWTDTSGNGKNATLYNFTNDGTNGLVNGKMVFTTGNNYASIPAFFSGLTPVNQITVTIKDYKTTADGGWGEILSMSSNINNATNAFMIADRDEGIRTVVMHGKNYQIWLRSDAPYDETYDLTVIFQMSESPTTMDVYANTTLLDYRVYSNLNNTNAIETFNDTYTLFIGTRGGGQGFLNFECSAIEIRKGIHIPQEDTVTHVTEGLSLYLDSANKNNTTTTLADMSGNGNDFTSAVSIALNSSNRITLDGSQYFSNASYQPHTTTDNDFTFEFFGDIESSNGGRNYFFSYGSRNGFSWDEQQGLSGQMGSGDVIWVGTDTVGGKANRIAPTFGEKHVIITKNGTTYSIYIDGALVQSVEYTTSWSASYTNFRLFTRYNTSNQLHGAMKYVRWYTKGFTAEEVTQNYNSRNN